ncbi:pre-tape measure chaperone protein [Caulobacter phage C1]|nr:pre-tape measure chaperone protein [Caulobacter phage C1]UTU08382.1 pre-tape measure chaperone protein [Caulobacter phage C2]UTU08899.1 pre-tape measure chaperone protein [Caulobacter phage J4]UTU09455.1 pre-tape measure chaperone protein [Caulobacter phage BL47]UTU10015.1 pre-tape measure chaperone protein [Caulobacter phage RB23]WGN97040.1 pre-tape measure chaperone protein [Bertelyvirus sp.]
MSKKTDKVSKFLEDLRAEGIIDGPSEPENKQIEVYTDLIWVWNAFWRLSAARDIGFDRPNRIKVSEVKAYADLKRLAPHKASELLFYVDVLDECWMEHAEDARAKAEEERKKKQKDITPTKARPKGR